MPVTSDDLWLINADKSDQAKLDQALDYIQTAMPIGGNASIQEFVLKRDIKIEFNHEGDVAYVPGEKTIKWDPDKGVEVRDSEGNFLGVNSPHLPCSTKSIIPWTPISLRTQRI